MAVLALDAAHPDADDAAIRRYLSNNLCRCSGYASQQRAIRRFLARHQNGGELPRAPSRTTPPPRAARGTRRSPAPW